MNEGTLKVAKIEDHRPQATATHTISYILDGFPVTSVIETTAPIRDVVSRLRAIGAEPPALQNLQTAEPTKKSAPLCPEHGTPMKASRKPGSWFCPRQAEDGSGYCPHKA